MLTRLGLRTRLFLGVVVVVGVAALISGWWLSIRLRGELVADAELHLVQHARTLARVIEPGADAATITRLADDFALTTGARITVIAGDGLVFADSDVTEVEAMDNHASRPEIVAALRDGYGTSMRFSDTVRRDMLYVAVPWPAEHPIGVIRVSRPLDEVERRVARMSRTLGFAGVVTLVLTLLLAAGFAERFTRDLRQLTARARSLARPDADDRDEIAWISGSIDRLTRELEQAVDAVADERNRLHAVLAGMGEALIAVDTAGAVTLTNPAARALLDLDSGVVGQQLILAVGSPELAERVDRVLRTGEAEIDDLTWLGSDATSSPRALVVTITPQLGGGAVVLLHDITELRRLEKVRRDFVANVSHELRTPVAVIQSSSEALLDGALEDPEHGPRFVDAIGRHARRLAALISDLLELARIERGGLELAVHPVDLREIARDALEPLEARAASQDQTLVLAIGEATRALADAAALRQVIANLVENAVKYTPAGSTITVRSEPGSPGQIRLIVEDDGPGIPQVHHDRIFERFYRVDPGRSRDMGGTGLGLAIVRHLVEIQGGRVELGHVEPHGARFSVELPRP